MLRSWIPMALLLGSVTACSGDGWYGGGEEPPLPGERISVLSLKSDLKADPNLAGTKVTLPPAVINNAWPQQGGEAARAMQHLALAAKPDLAWKAGIGEGSTDSSQLLARPVLADGRLFAMDAFGSISAFDAKTGKLIWQKTYRDLELDDSVFGGGLALDGGVLIAAFTSGDVISLEAQDGTQIWKQELGLPLRSAPTISDGFVLVPTADNQVYALDRQSGQPNWRHAGFFETSAVLGGPSPAVDGGIAVIPYSSAEVFALRLDNGRPLWSDTLERPRRTQGLAQINDIDGTPVIDGDRVYIGGRGGQVAAIDIRRGIRAWDADLTAVDTPWLAGDFIYLVTERNEAVCLFRRDGRIRWVTQLPLTDDPEGDDGNAVTWRGPILAGDQLIVTNSKNEALTLSPYTGERLSSIPLPDPAAATPIVADGTIYFLTEEAELLAFR